MSTFCHELTNVNATAMVTAAIIMEKMTVTVRVVARKVAEIVMSCISLD